MADDWNPMWTGPRTGDAWIAYCDGHPAARLVGLRALASGEDAIEFTVEDAPVINPNGAVHGGVLATALDHVLGVTAMLAMPDDGFPNTAGMNVQYLRPAMAPLRIDGRVTKGGRSLVFVRAEVFARDGKLCATCDGTFAVMTPGQITGGGR